VVDNLLSNAIKFSLPGTTVTISVQTGPDFFSIDVTDQGIGMSKEDIQNAFQRGVRLSARPTADEPSSGLGLWIVKRLVEAHDGSVTVQSEVGIGTTFTVMLPYGNPSAKMAS
jgi:signal transduction histidine kinase